MEQLLFPPHSAAFVMKNKSLRIACLSLAFCSLTSSAQNKDKNGRYKTPDVLESELSMEALKSLESKDFRKVDNSNTRQYWTVFSDRNSNALYSEPNGTKNGNELGFQEALAVINAAEGGWLEVTGVGAADLNSRGWIQAENLVLSRKPVVNGQRNSRKVMILPSLNEDIATNGIDISKMRFSSFQSYPSSNEEHFLMEAKRLRVYFVMKESQGFLLLAATDHIDRSDLIGWVPKEIVTQWDRRVAYAPSYGSNGAAHTSRTIPVYKEKRDLDRYIAAGMPVDPGIVNGQKLRSQSATNPPKATSLHMPDVGNDRNLDEISREVVTIARINEDAAEADLNSALAKIDRIRSQRNKLNIVFVMDATQSMGPYFGAVSNSIASIVESAQDISEGTTVKFGAVIYRDYEDGNDRMKTIPLTSDITRFSKNIREIQCFSKDSDLPEALYMGITEGLAQLNLSSRRNETNLVILIGDAGNKPKSDGGYSSLEEVKKTLDQCKASIICFQPFNKKAWTFQSYRDDAIALIQHRAQSEVSFNRNRTSSFEYYDAVYGNEDDTWKSFGAVSFPLGSSNSTSAKVLEKMVIQSTSRFLERLNLRIEDLSKISIGEPVTDDMIADWEGAISPAEIKALREMGDFSFRAHTTVGVPGIPEPCLTPFIFMTQQDLDKRRAEFARISKASNTKQYRKILADIILETAANLLGEVAADGNISEATRAKLEQRTLGELWEDLFLTQCELEHLRSVKLGELVTRDEIEIDFELDLIKIKAEDFSIKPFDTPEYRFAPPGAGPREYFYWIPASEFPGSK